MFENRKFFEGWENAIVPIMIMLVIMLNGRRICLDSGTVYNCTYERLVERQERLLTEADNFQNNDRSEKYSISIWKDMF